MEDIGIIAALGALGALGAVEPGRPGLDLALLVPLIKHQDSLRMVFQVNGRMLAEAICGVASIRVYRGDGPVAPETPATRGNCSATPDRAPVGLSVTSDGDQAVPNTGLGVQRRVALLGEDLSPAPVTHSVMSTAPPPTPDTHGLAKR